MSIWKTLIYRQKLKVCLVQTPNCYENEEGILLPKALVTDSLGRPDFVASAASQILDRS